MTKCVSADSHIVLYVAFVVVVLIGVVVSAMNIHYYRSAERDRLTMHQVRTGKAWSVVGITLPLLVLVGVVFLVLYRQRHLVAIYTHPSAPS